MRWVVWLLIAFAAAVGLALLLRFNQGNVAILWPPYRIDISVNLVLAALAAAFVLLHLVLVGASRALGLPQRVREYRLRRQQGVDPRLTGRKREPIGGVDAGDRSSGSRCFGVFP
jgi:HemY protein